MRTGETKLSPRRRLLRDIIILVLLTAGIILALFVIQGKYAVRQLANDTIQRINQDARDRFFRFLEPVESSLTIAKGWAASGLLNPGDVIDLNAKFIPILEQLPQVSSVILATDDGWEYFLSRNENRWRTRFRDPGRKDGTVRWQLWESASKPSEGWSEKDDFDPRSRVWYKGAAETPQGVYWSRPYQFKSWDVPGITASISWQPAGVGSRRAVLGFDIPLMAFHRLFADLNVGEAGRVFLCSGEGAVFVPGSSKTLSAGATASKTMLTPADSVNDPMISAGLRLWRDQDPARQSTFSFTCGSVRCWGSFIPVSQRLNTVWIAAVVPEVGLLGDLGKRRYLFIVAALVVLGGGVGAAFLLVRIYGSRLKELPESILGTDDFPSRLDATIAMGESATREFKSTMRMNLKSGKAGKEIELAWLKAVAGFMNTDGGILLLGVNDDGDIVGLEPDGFENEDKCRLHFKNLLKQHIGLEFSKHILFELKTVGACQVAVVECERSPEPVFLKNKADEDFYIRSGPASVRLPVSKVIHYLKNRG